MSHRRRRREDSDDTPGHRHARLQHILMEELEALVRGELTDPRLEGLTIRTVELSVDGRNARILFNHEEGDEVLPILEKATPFFRARLADTLNMKRLPILRFMVDPLSGLFADPGVQ